MLQVGKIKLANCWCWIVRALDGYDAEIAPKPPLAQKCFGEIAVVGHHDFDSGSRNTVLAYNHFADHKSYLCRSTQKREHLIENLNSSLDTRDGRHNSVETK